MKKTYTIAEILNQAKGKINNYDIVHILLLEVPAFRESTPLLMKFFRLLETEWFNRTNEMMTRTEFLARYLSKYEHLKGLKHPDQIRQALRDERIVEYFTSRLTSDETIRRARRKVAETYPELKGSEKAELLRQERYPLKKMFVSDEFGIEMSILSNKRLKVAKRGNKKTNKGILTTKIGTPITKR